MLKYGTTNVSPHHMNSVLVISWDNFKVSAGNIIKDSFGKTKLPPFRPPNLTTNTQICDASTQLPSGFKFEEINNILRQTVAPIEL